MNYLKIKNFGPVEEAYIELKPFLVLIGGQGTGKSTIAKLVSIFQDYLWYINLLMVQIFMLRLMIMGYMNISETIRI